MGHPQKPTDIGSNRTGIATSPVDARLLIEAAERAMPNPVLSPPHFREIHEELCQSAPPIGRMPPPASVKGLAKTAMQALKGNRATVLLDKLAERLAFERSGVRLYEALMFKYSAAAADHLHGTGVTLADLEEICEDELRHFGMLKLAIEELGGDPTVMTPCADVMGVASSGLVQVLTDPRVTFTQCLDAILTAELVDNDGWELLIALTEGFGQTDMAARFRVALAEEADHLARVRGWLKRALVGQAGVDTRDEAPS